MTPKIQPDAENKDILCPICQGRLMYGLEASEMHLKLINPKTGKLQVRTKIKNVMNFETRGFLLCADDNCEFLADDQDEIFADYQHLFERIDTVDADAFAKEVK